MTADVDVVGVGVVVEPNEKAGLLAVVVELAPKLRLPEVGAALLLVENKPPDDCGAFVVVVADEPKPKPELEPEIVGAAAAVGVAPVEKDVLPKLKPDEAGVVDG